LEGTGRRLPIPPRGVEQRRITYTADLKYPGIQGPRHWLRSSPDGSKIAFLSNDDAGIVQLWTVSPNGGAPRQLTRNPWPVDSAFSWSPNGAHITHVMDSSVCLSEIQTGQTARLTPRSDPDRAPRPEACVFSPDGKKIAYVRHVPSPTTLYNQVFISILK
jgi:Tol biopolymer transport system component